MEQKIYVPFNEENRELQKLLIDDLQRDGWVVIDSLVLEDAQKNRVYFKVLCRKAPRLEKMSLADGLLKIS